MFVTRFLTIAIIVGRIIKHVIVQNRLNQEPQTKSYVINKYNNETNEKELKPKAVIVLGAVVDLLGMGGGNTDLKHTCYIRFLCV